MEGIMDSAPADVGGPEAFGHVIAASRVDIVHHQVEGCRGSGFWCLCRFSDDDMRASAKLQDRKFGVFENRA